MAEEHARMVDEYKAFVERFTWYSVGVIDVLGDKDYVNKIAVDANGTGTLCTWNGVHFVLTADHVLGKEPNLAFFVRQDEVLNWEGSALRQKVTERVLLPVERLVRCPEHDLAAVVLRSSELAGRKLEFCDLPRQLATDRKIRTEGSLLIHGFPVERRIQLSQTRTNNSVANYLIAIPEILNETLADEPTTLFSFRYYDRERDVLLTYTPSNPNLDPEGFSGAGAWISRVIDPGKLWSADPILFGVETRAFKDSKRLIVVGAPAVRQFLQDSFG